MNPSSPLRPNHHGDHAGFSGLHGLLAALTMIVGRGAVARLAADLTAVTTHDRVVDIGCGPGVAVREAARRRAQVSGVDPAPLMLRLARLLTRDSPSITWVEGAVEALPLATASASVVWSLSTVHHWADLEAGLAESHRILGPGGRLLLSERQVRPGATGLASHGWVAQQAQEVAERCRQAGFSEVSVEDHTAGRHHLLVARAVRP